MGLDTARGSTVQWWNGPLRPTKMHCCFPTPDRRKRAQASQNPKRRTLGLHTAPPHPLWNTPMGRRLTASRDFCFRALAACNAMRTQSPLRPPPPPPPPPNHHQHPDPRRMPIAAECRSGWQCLAKWGVGQLQHDSAFRPNRSCPPPVAGASCIWHVCTGALPCFKQMGPLPGAGAVPLATEDGLFSLTPCSILLL